MQVWQTQNEQQTEDAGRALAETLRGGEVITLRGDLGAGKTVFTRGLARGLGIASPILSPTFTIVREYTGRLKLYHFDFYRLIEAEELGEIGFEEYMQSDAVVVIEWAELFPEVLPARRISVQIEASGGAAAGRKICIWQEEELEKA